jgi:hypothetical protein
MSAGALRLGKDDHRPRACQVVVKLLRLALEEQVPSASQTSVGQEMASATPSLTLKASEALKIGPRARCARGVHAVGEGPTRSRRGLHDRVEGRVHLRHVGTRPPRRPPRRPKLNSPADVASALCRGERGNFCSGGDDMFRRSVDAAVPEPLLEVVGRGRASAGEKRQQERKKGKKRGRLLGFQVAARTARRRSLVS